MEAPLGATGMRLGVSQQGERDHVQDGVVVSGEGPRYRHRQGIERRGWRHAAEHHARTQEMVAWCSANLEPGAWDLLEIPPINDRDQMAVFRFAREEDRVLFAMVMG